MLGQVATSVSAICVCTYPSTPVPTTGKQTDHGKVVKHGLLRNLLLSFRANAKDMAEEPDCCKPMAGLTSRGV